MAPRIGASPSLLDPRFRRQAPRAFGATSTVPEMAWVRTDGRKIADDPALLQQGKSDIAACNANLDTGAPTETARGGSDAHVT
jgi:hypothetical protein